jgi:hypothetical protein
VRADRICQAAAALQGKFAPQSHRAQLRLGDCDPIPPSPSHANAMTTPVFLPRADVRCGDFAAAEEKIDLGQLTGNRFRVRSSTGNPATPATATWKAHRLGNISGWGNTHTPPPARTHSSCRLSCATATYQRRRLKRQEGSGAPLPRWLSRNPWKPRNGGGVLQAATALATSGFLNYFGLQRFGTHAVPTHAVGVALLAGDFAAAVELILMVSASLSSG